MSIFSWIGSLFKPAVDLIDELHVSDEERLKLRNELASIQSKMQAKSAEVMIAESKSDHWIVAAVRPICTLVLFSIILIGSFGYIKTPPEVYSLAEIFMSIYAGGRSLEKSLKMFKK